MNHTARVGHVSEVREPRVSPFHHGQRTILCVEERVVIDAVIVCVQDHTVARRTHHEHPTPIDLVKPVGLARLGQREQPKAALLDLDEAPREPGEFLPASLICRTPDLTVWANMASQVHELTLREEVVECPTPRPPF